MEIKDVREIAESAVALSYKFPAQKVHDGARLLLDLLDLYEAVGRKDGIDASKAHAIVKKQMEEL